MGASPININKKSSARLGSQINRLSDQGEIKRIWQRNSPFVEEFICPRNPIFSNSLGTALEMKMAALKGIFYYFREAGSICSAIENIQFVEDGRCRFA
jgi:hypothetical protein